MDKLKIAINAQLSLNSIYGGIEGFVLALVSALGKLEGPEEYTVITSRQNPEWIKPYIGPNTRIVSTEKPKELLGDKFSKAVGKILKRAWPAAGQIKLAIKQSGDKIGFPRWFVNPVSDEFYERLGVDAIHFPYQKFMPTSIPSVYNPHDLQHLHYPQFFSQQQIEWRETMYRRGCRESKIVAVTSQWVKQDLVKQYGMDPAKIQVIPVAPMAQVFEQPSRETLAEIKSKYQLATPFAFYPAMVWEHKNHLRLLEALAHLRDQDHLAVNLVCTGQKYPGFFPKIQERLDTLKLNHQVKFLGLLPNSELRAIYRLAQFVIVPTLFEAASGPVFEAWQEGTSVACSNVTSLPEQAGNAALLFEPTSARAIAEALKQMALNENLRKELIVKGAKRLGDFSWERTAKAYRAVYRKAAGRKLSGEDQMLLSWDWMKDPQREGTSCRNHPCQ